MKRVSAKREEQLEIYRQVKKELFLSDLKAGKLRCFLSDKPIRIPEELRGESDDYLVKLIECHHIYGERENENLFDKDVMRPVLRYYHSKYHSMSIWKLLEEDWFLMYMKRIQHNNHNLWLKEQRKMQR